MVCRVTLVTQARMDQSHFYIPALTGFYSLCLGIEIVLQRTKWGNGKIGKDITGWGGRKGDINNKDNNRTAIRTWKSLCKRD